MIEWNLSSVFILYFCFYSMFHLQISFNSYWTHYNQLCKSLKGFHRLMTRGPTSRTRVNCLVEFIMWITQGKIYFGLLNCRSLNSIIIIVLQTNIDGLENKRRLNDSRTICLYLWVLAKLSNQFVNICNVHNERNIVISVLNSRSVQTVVDWFKNVYLFVEVSSFTSELQVS